jgi:hypothetical protein
MRWTKLDSTYIYFEKNLNQFNTLYIYLQQDKSHELMSHIMDCDHYLN